MSSYESLKTLADSRWSELTDGNVPWIRIGMSMCCGQASGAYETLAEIKQQLKAKGIEANVSEVGCLGICYASPVVDILLPKQHRSVYGNITADLVMDLIDRCLLKGKLPKKNLLGVVDIGDTKLKDLPNFNELPQIKLQNRIALRNAGHIDPKDIYQYIARGGYLGLNRSLTDLKPEDVIEEVKSSGLRGRGGAAFPTGVKWSFMTRGEKPKYILCNCEEGDPGAFNDKAILESDPYTTIEGMTIAAYATGSTNGIIFIRHGHDGPIKTTEDAIKQAYEVGLLGQNILGSDFSFDLEVSLTGESYVAGEETALMEAVEGKRSMPRARPPFPAAYGVWGRPSTINNVKSLSYAPSILENGPEWFSSIGVNKSTGTAIICLSGNIKYPGLYEVPMGLTIGEVIDDFGGGVPGGRKLKMLQTGGPLGGVLSSDSLEIRLDFDEMREAGAILGSGGIIVADDRTCAVDLTRVLVAFCQFESCGKCFPCRLGTTNLLEIVERMSSNKARMGDVDLMKQIGQTMQAGSLCGHGQLGFNPIESAMKHFKEDWNACVDDGKCLTGSCDKPYFTPINTRPFADSPIKNAVPINIAEQVGEKNE